MAEKRSGETRAERSGLWADARRRTVDSLTGLGKVRPLVLAATLLSIQVVLGLVAAIPIGDYIRISFGYIALSMTAALLGPAASMLNGALADVIGFIIHPTGPYFPGFTLTGVVSGAIYGYALYERPMTLRRIMLTKLVIDLFCNLILNTLWLYLLYGKGFWVRLPARALKNLLQYPVDVAILYPFLTRIMPAARRVLDR